MTKDDIKKQAIRLAKDNRDSDDQIKRVYWFPHNTEVRLVELHEGVPPSGETTASPYYFKPSPQHDLPAPSGVALIRPDEYKKIAPPDEWGSWDEAEELGVDA